MGTEQSYPIRPEVHDADVRNVADRLVDEMSPDCAPNCHATEEQETRLRVGIAKMAGAGVDFTDEDIELIAAGDHAEATDRFGSVPGYAEVAAVLIEIFDNEEEP